MTIELVKPDLAFEASYRDYITELGDEDRYPFPMDFDHRDFPAMLQRIDDFELGRNLPLGFVSSSTFWFVEGRALLGASNLRHELNEEIERFGGHIGLGIRPSARGRGLGRELLRQTLMKARDLGIEEVHIHCYKHNQRSAAMIRHCGGLLVSEAMNPAAAQVVQRFVIAQSDGAPG